MHDSAAFFLGAACFLASFFLGVAAFFLKSLSVSSPSSSSSPSVRSGRSRLSSPTTGALFPLRTGALSPLMTGEAMTLPLAPLVTTGTVEALVLMPSPLRIGGYAEPSNLLLSPLRTGWRFDASSLVLGPPTTTGTEVEPTLALFPLTEGTIEVLALELSPFRIGMSPLVRLRFYARFKVSRRVTLHRDTLHTSELTEGVEQPQSLTLSVTSLTSLTRSSYETTRL